MAFDPERWLRNAQEEIAENNVLGYLLDIAAGVMPNPTVGQVRACEVLLKFMVASPQAARTTDLPHVHVNLGPPVDTVREWIELVQAQGLPERRHAGVDLSKEDQGRVVPFMRD
jgi:hypothetical protein